MPRMAAYVEQELRKVGSQLERYSMILFNVLHAEPPKPREGQVVLADGSDWDPGSGAGPYMYLGSAWVFLGFNPSIPPYGYRSLAIFTVGPDDNVVTTTDAKSPKFSIPADLNGFNLVTARGRVNTAGSGTGTTDVEVYNQTDSVNMCSSDISIATTGTSDEATVDTAHDDVATNDIIRIKVTAVASTAPKGLEVRLTFALP